MKIARVFTFAIVLIAFCIAGQPKVASGQATEGGWLEWYTGMMNQLRTELTAAIPKAPNEKQVTELLTSDKLDAKLVKYAVLQGATPQGLADFAQQGKGQAQLIEQLLSDTKLMN